MIMQRFRIAPRTAIGLTRMLFGTVCLANARFHFKPAYEATFFASLAAAWAPGQPGWLATWGHINAVGVAALGTEPAVNAMAGLELVLALSLIAGAWLHRLAWVGMAYNLWLWSTVGGLGGPYTIGVTDPGATIVYVLAFALVLLTHAWRPLSLFQGGPTQKPDHWKLRLGEIAFALLWAFDAYWKWQPEFLLHGVNNLIAAQAGQPAWIVAYIGFFIRAIELVGPVIFGVSVALVESAIAMALLAGVALQWILPLGAVYSLVLWTTGEGWGGPYAAGITGNKGDVLGTGIIYVLLFLMSMAARAEHATRRRAVTG